jgi:hypothetical protein
MAMKSNKPPKMGGVVSNKPPKMGGRAGFGKASPPGSSLGGAPRPRPGGKPMPGPKKPR